LTLASLKEKLALGTVQLGLPYGINNKTGKPSQEEAFHILDNAIKQRITMLDSAEAYGDSNRVIGSYLKAHAQSNVKVVSKFIEDGTPILNKFETSLKHLNRKSLYAYLYHRFNDYQSGGSKAILLRLKEEGKIEKIGVSVYSINELKTVVGDADVNVIQIPFNVLDASSEKKQLLKIAKSLGKEIHARSIFLQGLFFKEPKELTGNLRVLALPIQEFHTILNEYNLSVLQACLNHALHNPLIDRVIIGVERSSQLDQNLEALLPYFPEEWADKLESISVPDMTLLNPSNWKA
jgi:aryl-alcohol dehydrogenase-like predicted oxidoreductase